MASRFDQPSEPDFDRYDTRTDDIDVPDFDQPELGSFVAMPADELVALVERNRLNAIDPVEHAAQDAARAFGTLAAAIETASDLDRVLALRSLARELWRQATNVCDKAAARCDEDLERRR